MKINDQITDTFIAYDGNWNRIGGLTFNRFCWLNGVSSNTTVTVTEDTVTGGAYKLQFTPTATGEWYIHLFNLSASFDAYYFVDSGVGEEVWNYPTTGSGVVTGSMGQALSGTWQVQTGRWRMFNNQLILYDADGVTPLKTFNLYDSSGTPSLSAVVHRIPV